MEMTASGMEKFAHLVDKLHRSVALCESLRREKSHLEVGLREVQLELAVEKTEKERLLSQTEALLKDREAIRLKVENMMDTITMLEIEADSIKK
ncbi:MAG: hypothetical protein M3X11_25670 [Acidobacteriota bacterium]|nr:hypothetical protein [Acidobacteriota bacterium]